MSSGISVGDVAREISVSFGISEVISPMGFSVVLFGFSEFDVTHEISISFQVWRYRGVLSPMK